LGPLNRFAIVGSRHYPSLSRVAEYVNGLPKGSTIVTGSASGVDAEATKAARGRELAVIRLAASFEEARDARAAVERNQKLIDQADVVVAFWDGASQGTRGTIDRALDSGKEVHVFIDRLQT
jgi:predicted Rossmann fold nucleotide-binding protein DprA/Smf involved in DNA uptake